MIYTEHPIIIIIHNLHKYNLNDIIKLKILSCLKRTNKEFKNYINEELDRSKYSDPIYNVLWRTEDPKSVVYNNIVDYNNYLKKKETTYFNIYLENAKICNDTIKINKVFTEKNIKYIFNIFIVNCIIDVGFTNYSFNNFKTVNLYIINCTFGLCKALGKNSYGGLTFINCTSVPRLNVDNLEKLDIIKCKIFEDILFNLNNRKYWRGDEPYFDIKKCKNINIAYNICCMYTGTILHLSRISNLKNLKIYNNCFLTFKQNFEGNLVISKSINKPTFYIKNNYNYIITYNNLKIILTSTDLYCKNFKKKILIQEKIISENKIINFDHTNNTFYNDKIIIYNKINFGLNNLIIRIIKYNFNQLIKKDLEIYNKKEIIKKLQTYISDEIKYNSMYLDNNQLFIFLLNNKI